MEGESKRDKWKEWENNKYDKWFDEKCKSKIVLKNEMKVWQKKKKGN